MCVRACTHIYACIYFVCTCACACEISIELEWRSEGNCGSQLSPPTMWVLGLNSRQQAWQQHLLYPLSYLTSLSYGCAMSCWILLMRVKMSPA